MVNVMVVGHERVETHLQGDVAETRAARHFVHDRNPQTVPTVDASFSCVKFSAVGKSHHYVHYLRSMSTSFLVRKSRQASRCGERLVGIRRAKCAVAAAAWPLLN